MTFERYDYKAAMIDDVREVIHSDFDDPSQYDNIEEYREAIYESCWEGSVTGNSNGGYYTDDDKASFYLAGNWDLLDTAYEEFAYRETKTDILEKGAAWCDCLIRCYLLGGIVDFCIRDIDPKDPRFADNKEASND